MFDENKINEQLRKANESKYWDDPCLRRLTRGIRQLMRLVALAFST